MRFSAIALFLGVATASFAPGMSHGGDAPKSSPTADAHPTKSEKHESDKHAGMTESIIYQSKVYTVTSCAPEVTNCPAHSTQVITSVIAIPTTICPESESSKAAATAAVHEPSESCSSYTETCTVTVTAPKPGATGSAPYLAPKNVTNAVTGALTTGTGTPTKPNPAYYSNSANALAGGALAIGAGAIAALIL